MSVIYIGFKKAFAAWTAAIPDKGRSRSSWKSLEKKR